MDSYYNEYDFKEMIREIGQDVHPPLYFVLLKLIVTLFGQHIEIMKIVSVIPTIILMAIGKKYIKHIFKSDFICRCFYLFSRTYAKLYAYVC